MTLRIPFGQRVAGKIKVQCQKCGHIWWYVLGTEFDDRTEVLGEVMGMRCPGCGMVAGHKVLFYQPETILDDWFQRGAEDE